MMQRNRPGHLLGGHPSIFPSHAPNHITSAADSDLKYVQSQGTHLVSAICAESQKHGKEAFALLWDSVENEWFAAYKMSILVRKCPSPSFLIERCQRLWVVPLSRDVN